MTVPPEASTCPHCGAPLDRGALYCAECGGRVGPPPPPTAVTGTTPPPPVAYGPPAVAHRPPPAPLEVTALAPAPRTPVGVAPPPPAAPAAPPPLPLPAEPVRRRTPPPAPVGADGVLPVPPDAVVPIGRRVLAFVVDGLVVGVPFAVLYLVLVVLPAANDPAGAARLGPAMAVPSAVALVIGLGQLIAEGATGATVGNAALGIRTVRAADARPAGFGRVLLRQLVVAAGTLVCLVGQWFVVASGAWDRSPARRGWHDKTAGTLVLWAASLPGLRAGSAGRAGSGARTGVPAPIDAPPASARTTAGTPPWASAPPAPAAPPAVQPPPVDAPVPPVDAPAPPVDAPAPPGPPAPVPPVPRAPWSVAAPPVAAPSPVPPSQPEPVLVWPPTLVPPVQGEQGEREQVPAQLPEQTDLVPLPDRSDLVPLPDRSDLVPLPDRADLVPLPDRADTVPSPDLVDLVPLPPRAPATSTVPAVPVPDEALITGLPASLGTVAPSTQALAAPRVDLGELELTVLRERPSGAAAHLPLRLVFDTGEVVDVTGDGLVGRHPDAQPGIAHVVAVDDPARSVSKVHVAFGLDEDGWLWVVDRGSTNGTVLRAPGGAEAALPAGVRAVVGPGWTVRFGERSALVEPA